MCGGHRELNIAPPHPLKISPGRAVLAQWGPRIFSEILNHTPPSNILKQVTELLEQYCEAQGEQNFLNQAGQDLGQTLGPPGQLPLAQESGFGKGTVLFSSRHDGLRAAIYFLHSGL